MTSGELQQPRAGKQRYNKAFGHSLRTWLPLLLVGATSMHSVWIFPNGWGCHTQHDTDYTAANLPSNLMHSWSTGSNQFSAFTVWWIWPTSYDLGPLCYKYGHAFSAVYKTYGRNPSRGCFMQQTSMGLCCMNSIAYHAYRDGWIEELLLWAVVPKVLLPNISNLYAGLIRTHADINICLSSLCVYLFNFLAAPSSSDKRCCLSPF